MKSSKAIASILALVLLFGMTGCGRNDADKYHSYKSKLNAKVFSLTYSKEYTKGEETLAFTDEELSNIDREADEIMNNALLLVSCSAGSPSEEINAAVDMILEPDTRLTELIGNVLGITNLLGGAYHPVFGAVSELYNNTNEVAADIRENALVHTGEGLISFEAGKVVKNDREAKIDYTQFSSGYAVSLAVNYLKSQGVSYAVVSYDGTVGTIGEKSKKDLVDVAIFTSQSEENAIGKIKIKDTFASVITKKEKLVDYKTGELTNGLYDTAVVISKDAVLSDILSRVIYTMDFEVIRNLYNSKIFDFEAVVINDDGTYKMTDGANTQEIFETKPDTAK